MAATGNRRLRLPDLRGRVPIHMGNGFILAETGGAEEITLTVNQIPAHTHAFLGSANNVSTTQPANNVGGVMPTVGVTPYGTDIPRTTLNPQSVSPVGGSQPHTNFQPYLCVDFIISLFGIFPPPS